MFFFRLLTIFLCVLCISLNNYAQVTHPFEIVFSNANQNINSGNYNQASSLLKDAVNHAKNLKNRINEARSYDLLAEISIKKREFKDFKVYDALATSIAAQLKDTALLLSLSNRKGIYYMEEGQNDLAEVQYTTALNLSLIKKDTKKAAEVYSNLGSLYLAIGDRNKAATNFFNALKLHELDRKSVV